MYLNEDESIRTTAYVFLRGFAYPTQWEVVNTKLIFDIVHYELKDVRSPKTVVLSEWALTKDDSWKIKK